MTTIGPIAPAAIVSRFRQGLPTDMRPSARFVTVVWGREYILRFTALALPSFIAPGNLPALARATDLEVIIMTQRADIEYFEQQSAFRRLRTICPVRFVEIDDLITTSVYGVTLTLAYARAVMACGKAMLETHFVFMNADFVLGDGSLHALSKHILDGRSIVLGPSFRASAEALEPVLEEAVDPVSCALAISPRELTALSFPHAHPTTIAKIVGQAFCHSIHSNQFFWQVDENTLLGRYYLIFMLCLRPERLIETVNCFCDYGFIPEACPSGDEVVMDDSDSFFMLELQRHDQEMQLLRLGRQSDSEIAGSLQQWTTAEHRRAASHDIVFHTGEIPANIERARTEATAFIERIGRRLGPPISHIGHPYWVSGVASWRSLRMAHGLPADPPELGALPAGNYRSASKADWKIGLLTQLWSTLVAAQRTIMGVGPRASMFHPNWADYQLLQQAVNALPTGPDARVLVVSDHAHVVRRLGTTAPPGEMASLHTVLGGNLLNLRQNDLGYTHVFIFLMNREYRHARKLLESCQAVMPEGGACQLFIHDPSNERDLSSELLWYLDDVVSPRSQATQSFWVGGSIRRGSSLLFANLKQRYTSFRVVSLLWILPLAAVVLLLIFIGNLRRRLSGPSRRAARFSTTAMIDFVPRRDSSPVAARGINEGAEG